GFEAELPLNQEVSFDVKTDQRGEYGLACGMNMFKGKVVVK
ncbi:cupredoxin domain-containing protein, partial [Limosilactobacillus fermentum]|nr:cupredoxin domain-containing protein [Limosilactobacillus fermentum]